VTGSRTSSVIAAISRNARCPCNSGLRYKHCCGALQRGMAAGLARRERARDAALAMQLRGDFFEAIDAYDAILRERPGDWDVAHMRATCLYQLGAIDEASVAFRTLLGTPAAELRGFWTNLGLVLASIRTHHLASASDARLTAYRRLRPHDSPSAPPRSVEVPLPTVSVVLPAYGHANYVGEAIASVFEQTRAPLELIVIDDGSRDGTAERCRAALLDAPFPVSFIERENRGAAATLNQGVDLARGEFIQLLNSDDRLPRERIETMLGALLAHDADWGYGRVALIDGQGNALHHTADARAATLLATQDAALMSPTPGLAMLRANSAISSGNLTFRKRLWRTLGGFREYRYNHDWDFCLRATLEGEPVLVPRPLYDYRIHGANTILEGHDAARREQRRIMAAFIGLGQGRHDWPNAFAPTLRNWGGEFLALLGATGALRQLPPGVIEHALSSDPPAALVQ
jgi:glycosyltransferase involved in cell wall biosynthesis